MNELLTVAGAVICGLLVFALMMPAKQDGGHS